MVAEGANRRDPNTRDLNRRGLNRPGKAGPGETSRRSVVFAALLTPFAPSAFAQDPQWWEKFPGFGRPEGARHAANDERRRPEALNDLRPDQVPLRSQQMVEALDDAIQRYQQIVSNGGWPAIPGTRPIRPEDNDGRVELLYRRLAASGEWTARPSQTFFGIDYSEGLESAVRRFQENHGLRVTGRVDRATLQALNIPAQARLAQLRINQQRLRDLLAQRIEDRYVLVNAASFQLEAVERHQVALRHRVIVGKPDRQTPTVRATIRALNFFPYWRVPESIANLDLIPRLVKEPGYLQQERIRVLTGSFNGPEIDASAINWRQVDANKLRFRQDPGPQNALGLVRIDMPNEHGVYLHDTPLKPLFNNRGRAFSAGCVRVQEVFTLVEWIAKHESGWEQPGRVQEVIAAGQALDVTLTRPVPVLFAYVTAWAELDGRVIFRPDMYARDGVRDLAASTEHDPEEGPAPRWTLAP
ncbi:MAG: L,D-transpeptidase family protein [Hyphomonadaceae bacterium]|jgi:murein L,D-transpeptidase YcbB/YkuD|nr:L,D-transpeptidase family protein [Hyphomonadaceae bacterium]